MLSCAHFFLKILQSLPVSYRVQTPPCSLGSMFWALLTFLASFPYKSLSYMLIYSIFLREVYFLPQCPYAALPLLEPFLSLPFISRMFMLVWRRVSNVLSALLQSSDVQSAGFACDFSGGREGIALCKQTQALPSTWSLPELFQN